MSPRVLLALLAAGALGAATAPTAATAAGEPPGEFVAARAPSAWATVNVCDTAGSPDGIGLRGAMSGTGDRHDTLFMRLRVQFQRGDGTWQSIRRGGDSGFLELGRGDARVRQAGRTFTVTPPPAGRPAYVLRGLVTFEWRRGDQVVRRLRRATQAGHGDTLGADPDGYSAATCSIR